MIKYYAIYTFFIKMFVDIMRLGLGPLSNSSHPLRLQHTFTPVDSKPLLYPPILHYLITWHRSHRYNINESATNFADAVSMNVAVAMWGVRMICLQSTSMPFQEFIDYKLTICTDRHQRHPTLDQTPAVKVDLDCTGKL